MAGFTKQQQADQLRGLLLDAVVKCSERCLYQSAKWAAEMATSLPPSADFTANEDTDPDSQMEDIDGPAQNQSSVISPNSDSEEARLEAKELPKYLLAKSYFDCREFERCAAVFLPTALSRGPLPDESPNSQETTPPKPAKGKGKDNEPAKVVALPPPNTLPNLSQKSLFLALYAKYMSGEKRKDEESEMILGPSDGGSTVNRELVGLSRTLEGWFADREAKGLSASNQGWLEYLYGIVLAKGKTEDAAKKWLLTSVHRYVYNWGAWLELGEFLDNMELQRIVQQLPQNFMTLIFHLHTSQTLYECTEYVHQELSSLEAVFPKSHFLKTERALLLHHSKGNDLASSSESAQCRSPVIEDEEAESVFSSLLHEDPYRLDAFSEYSNILYVMGERPKLAFLAQSATATDKFRPETCCVVGNYYALKSEHEKAVQYFRRALTLDRNCQAAWTLMGHEYLEMKNTHAAIESYRRAVDANRKDYRAWYGLGQTYEILEMYLYALFYFQKAASLRPYDPKMWQAVGNCYDKVDKPLQSIKAYKRAIMAGTYYDSSVSSPFGSGASRETPSGILDPDILYQIALMHERMRNMDEAASYMELTMAQEDGPDGEDEDDDGDEQRESGTGVTLTTSRARMWLARWEYSRGNLSRAMDLANELCQVGAEVEEAKALIRDIRARNEFRK